MNEIDALCRRYQLDALYVFGSRADEIASAVKGIEVPAAQGSDVDIGVQPSRHRRLSARERARLAVELEDLFEAKRVDLTIIQEADPFLALEIIRGELLCCLDPESQAEFELFVLRRAGDLAHFERERREAILQGGGR
jgi:uncharacterized protein